MGCAPCAAMRAKLKQQVVTGDVAGAAKTTAEGVAHMVKTAATAAVTKLTSAEPTKEEKKE